MCTLLCLPGLLLRLIRTLECNHDAQAVSENLSLKQKIFRDLANELSPSAILASNTSSISLTKIAAATIAPNVSAASEKGKANASRVVGMKNSYFNRRGDQSNMLPNRLAFLQPRSCHG